MINNNGPRTVPWGAPEDTDIKEDSAPPRTTFLEWSVKKLATHLCFPLNTIPMKFV